MNFKNENYNFFDNYQNKVSNLKGLTKQLLEPTRFINIIKDLKISFVIFLISIIGTVVIWQIINANYDTQEKLEFLQESKKVEHHIKEKLELYINVLYGMQGLFASKETVSRQDFSTYTSKLDLLNRYPGISGLAYIEKVEEGNTQEFISKLQKDENLAVYNPNQFKIVPEGKRQVYYAIRYIESLNDKSTAFGYDVFSEPNRKQAIEKAVDTGKPVMTNLIDIVGLENTETGFIIFAPIYKNNADTSTIISRRESVIGLVSAVFRSDKFFDSIYQNKDLPPEVNFSVHEYNSLTNPTTRSLIYTSQTSSTSQTKSNLTQEIEMDIANHTWILNFKAIPNQGLILSRNISSIAAIIAGFTFSIVTLGLFFSSALTKQKLIKIAQTMSKKFKDSEEKFMFYFDNSPVPMTLVDSDYRFIRVNKAYCKQLGYTRNELLRKTIVDITHPEDIKRDLDLTRRLLNDRLSTYTVKKRYITKTGKILTGRLSAVVLHNQLNKPELGFGIFLPDDKRI